MRLYIRENLSCFLTRIFAREDVLVSPAKAKRRETSANSEFIIKTTLGIFLTLLSVVLSMVLGHLKVFLNFLTGCLALERKGRKLWNLIT